MGEILPEIKYGLFIPAAVLHDGRLTLFEKMLLSVLNALDGDDHCYASNETLASRLGTTRGRVANAITKLRKLRLVENVKLVRGDYRRLRCLFDREIKAKKKRSVESMSSIDDSSRERLSSIDDPLSSIDDSLSSIDEPRQVKASETCHLSMTDLSSIDDIEDRRKIKKEEEEEEKREEPLLVRKAPEMETEVLRIYSTCFPDYHPTAFQLDMILTTVVDLSIWNDSCRLWAGRGYQPRNIQGLVETYTRAVEAALKPPKTELSQTITVVDDGCPLCNTPPHSCPYHGG